MQIGNRIFVSNDGMVNYIIDHFTLKNVWIIGYVWELEKFVQ